MVCFFKTPRLLERCVGSLREHYPRVRLVLVDDGSRDEATEVALGMADDRTVVVIREDNRGHGAALNDGLARVETPYAFTLDSDVTVERGGFLEAMREWFEADPLLFAVGELVEVHDQPIYVRPPAMMMDAGKFRELGARFILHGAPALPVMVAANKAGYHVEDFPVLEYVNKHKGSGTRKALRRRIEAGEIDRADIARWQKQLRRQFKRYREE